MYNTLFFGKNKIGDYMLYYINTFYFYSIMGYFIELFLKTFIFKSMNSGILYGPWLPVYGFGGVIVIYIERFIFKLRNIPKIVKIIIVFFTLAILLSVIEHFGGVLIEFIFHKTFWDYSDMKFSISKYASLEMALVWGVGSLIIIYIINPLSRKFIKKIPIPITVLVSILFIIDCILTFIIR